MNIRDVYIIHIIYSVYLKPIVFKHLCLILACVRAFLAVAVGAKIS